MGFLDFIFGAPKKINDEFFGGMNFMEIGKQSPRNYFECKKYFQPLGKEIELAVDGDLNESREKQKEFFQKIENGYEEIKIAVLPIIEDTFQNWKENFEIVDFDKEFFLCYLSIPRCNVKPIVWEIAFDNIHDLNHMVTVLMEDWEAKGIRIDG